MNDRAQNQPFMWKRTISNFCSGLLVKTHRCSSAVAFVEEAALSSWAFTVLQFYYYLQNSSRKLPSSQFSVPLPKTMSLGLQKSLLLSRDVIAWSLLILASNALLMALNGLSAWIGMENWPPPCYSSTNLVILKILWPTFCKQSKIPLHIPEADRKQCNRKYSGIFPGMC